MSSDDAISMKTASEDTLHREWRGAWVGMKARPWCISPYWMVRIASRFMEISCRVFIFTLVWITLGGVSAGVIIAVEVTYFVIISILNRSIEDLRLIM